MYWLDRRLFNQLSGFDRLFNDLDYFAGSDRQPASNATSFPKLNVWKNKQCVLVRAEVPGVDPDKIELSAEANKLVIAGDRLSRAKGENDTYRRSERSTGKFQRELKLPFRINTQKISATCRNGILNVVLTLAEEEQPNRITVKAE